MRNLTKRFWTPIILAALFLSVAQARPQQQAPPAKSDPPTSPLPPAGQKADQEPAAPIATPTQTVTGGFAQTIGGSEETASRFLLGFTASELYDSNAPNGTLITSADEFTNISAHFDLHRIRQSSDLSFRYVGGGYLDAQHPQFNASYHQFEANQTIQFRRWKLKLDDLFSYLPQSPFGFEGGGPQGSTLLTVIYQDPSMAPGQSILTQAGRRLSNEAIGEVDVDLSARSALTFTGGFGYLHFLDPGFLDVTEAQFSAGYNYLLTRSDTIGVKYAYSDLWFNPVSGSIKNNGFQITYGHHITRELALQLGVGPELSAYTPPSTTVAKNAVVMDANASLAYQYNKTGLFASFYRGVNGGAGVVIGNVENIVEVGASQQLGRFWQVRAGGGSSYSQSLPQVSPIINTYVSSFVSAGITRQFGPRASIFLNYNFIRQVVGANNLCVGAACVAAFDKHQVWVGFSWDMRPIGLK